MSDNTKRIIKTERKNLEISTAVGIAFFDMQLCEEEVQGKKESPKRKKNLSNHTQRNHADLQKIKTMKQQVAHFNMIPMKMKDQTNKSCQKNFIGIKAGTFLAINTVLQNFSLQSNSHCIWFIQQCSREKHSSLIYNGKN